MTVAEINAGILVGASVAFSVLYIVSVRPARLSERTGRSMYRLCGVLRGIAMVFEFIALLSYVAYRFLPPVVPLPGTFDWSYWISLIIALTIGVPSTWLMVRGLRDAGREAAIPDPNHQMYSGIYRRVRHPQAIGESFIWFAVAFAVNSPLLVLYSLIWLPVFYLFCVVEEKDLLRRFGDSYAEYQKNVGMLIPKSP